MILGFSNIRCVLVSLHRFGYDAFLIFSINESNIEKSIVLLVSLYINYYTDLFKYLNFE